MVSFRTSFFATTSLWLSLSSLVAVLPAVVTAYGFKNTITDVVSDIPELSTLTDLLVLTGLADTLDDKKSPFTVFAPRNSAFGRLDPDVLEALLKEKNRDQLTDILLYHGAYLISIYLSIIYLSL